MLNGNKLEGRFPLRTGLSPGRHEVRTLIPTVRYPLVSQAILLRPTLRFTIRQPRGSLLATRNMGSCSKRWVRPSASSASPAGRHRCIVTTFGSVNRQNISCSSTGTRKPYARAWQIPASGLMNYICDRPVPVSIRKLSLITLSMLSETTGSRFTLNGLLSYGRSSAAGGLL